MRAFWTFAIMILAGAGWWALRPGQAEPGAVEHPGPPRPSLHAAPPDDFARLNRATGCRVPDDMKAAILPEGRPALLIFLSAGCGCSREFAHMFATLEPRLSTRASCLAVIAGGKAEVDEFVHATGLATPVISQKGARLAAAWGVEKAGVMALVRPDGLVEAVWPGISRQGFRDIAARLGAPGLFPDDALSVLPGAATAGCPLPSPPSDSPQGVSR
jgi:hypothetical protein